MRGGSVLFLFFLAQSFLYSISLYDTVLYPCLERHRQFQVTQEDATRDIASLTLALLNRIQIEKSEQRSGRKGDFWFLPFHFGLWEGIEQFPFKECHRGRSVFFEASSLSWGDLVSYFYLSYGYLLYSPYNEELLLEPFVFAEKKDFSAEQFVDLLSQKLQDRGFVLVSEGYFIRVEKQGYDSQVYQRSYSDLIHQGQTLLKDYPDVVQKMLIHSKVEDSVEPSVAKEEVVDFQNSTLEPELEEEDFPEETVALSFYSANIDNVLQFFSDISGYAIIKNPDVQGEITVMSISEVTLKDAFSILKVALSARGFFLKQDDLMKTILVTKRGDDIARETTAFVGDSVQDFKMDKETLVSKIIRLKYGNTNEIYQVVSSMVSVSGSVVPYALTNTLIVNDTVENVKRLVEIVTELDQENDQVKTKVILIKNADVFHVSSVLKEVGQQYRGAKEEFWVTEDKRTRSLFITGYQEGIDKAECLIEILDKVVPRIVCDVTFVRIPYVDSVIPLKFRLFSSLLATDNDPVRQSRVLDWQMAGQGGDVFSWCGFSQTQGKEDYLSILRSFFGIDKVDVVSMPLLILHEREEFVLDLSGNQFFSPLSDSRQGAFKLYPSITQDKKIHFDIHQKYEMTSGEIKEAFLQCVLLSQQTMVWGGRMDQASQNLSEKVFSGSLFEDVEDQVEVSVPPLLSNVPVDFERDGYSYLVFVTPVVVFDQESLGAFFHQTHQADQTSSLPFSSLEKASLLGQADLGVLFPGGFELQKTDGNSEKEALFLDLELNREGNTSVSNSNAGLKVELNLGEEEMLPVEHQMSSSMSVEGSVNLEKKVDSVAVETSSLKGMGDDEKKDDLSVSHLPHLDQESSVLSSEDKQIFLPDQNTEGSSSLPSSSHSTSLDSYVLKETLYRRGVTLYDQGKFREAIQEFAPLMTIDPHYKQIKKYMRLSQKQFQKNVVARAQDMEESSDTSHLVDIQESMQEKYDKAVSLQGEDEVYSEPVDINLKRGVVREKMSRIQAKIVDVSEDHPLVILDGGEFEGMAEGMIFRVYREDTFVGKLSIMDVDAHVSAARIISQESPDFKFQMDDLAILSEL